MLLLRGRTQLECKWDTGTLGNFSQSVALLLSMRKPQNNDPNFRSDVNCFLSWNRRFFFSFWEFCFGGICFTWIISNIAINLKEEGLVTIIWTLRYMQWAWIRFLETATSSRNDTSEVYFLTFYFFSQVIMNWNSKRKHDSLSSDD